MSRRLLSSLGIAVVVSALAVEAQAGWGSWGGSSGGSSGTVLSGGSTGSLDASSYGSSGGSWGGSSGGSYAGGSSGGDHGWGHHHTGPLRRLVAHIEAKKASWFGGHRHGGSHGGSSGGSSGGSWGGSSGGWSGGASSGGSSGGYVSHGSSGGSNGGSSGGSSGGWSAGDCCSGSDVIIEGGSTGESMETKPIPAAPTSTTQRESRKGTLVLTVPENAKVVVNGVETRTTGSLRRYVSHGLKPGQAYRYQVKTMVEKDGEIVEESREAILRAGEVTRLAFAPEQAPVQTRLTVRVPEDAKVYLSGRATQTSGSVRRFSSSKIAKGEQWADYNVRVTVERDGRTITKEKRISLAGGDDSVLAFDFDQTELADAR